MLGFSGRLQEGEAAEQPQEAGVHSLALLPTAASAAGRCMAATGVVHAFALTAGYVAVRMDRVMTSCRLLLLTLFNEYHTWADQR